MNPIIEMLRNWSELPAGVKLVEEKLTCNLFGYERRGGLIAALDNIDEPCQGTAEVTYRYYVVGDMKIPSTEKPTVTINAEFWHDPERPLVLDGISGELSGGLLVKLWLSQADRPKFQMILTTDIRTPAGELTLREGERPDYWKLSAES